jgi:hypothetical protein
MMRKLQEQVRHQGESEDIGDRWYLESWEQSSQLVRDRFSLHAASIGVFIWANSCSGSSQSVLLEHDIRCHSRTFQQFQDGSGGVFLIVNDTSVTHLVSWYPILKASSTTCFRLPALASLRKRRAIPYT